MFRARTWAAALPPAVWAAVGGLVLLASVGLALVVGAGLSVWRGGIGGAVKTPAVVVAPPRSGLVVVSPPVAATAPPHPANPAAGQMASEEVSATARPAPAIPASPQPVAVRRTRTSAAAPAQPVATPASPTGTVTGPAAPAASVEVAESTGSEDLVRSLPAVSAVARAAANGQASLGPSTTGAASANAQIEPAAAAASARPTATKTAPAVTKAAKHEHSAGGRHCKPAYVARHAKGKSQGHHHDK